MNKDYETRQITQFTAWEFLLEVQKAVQEGFRLSPTNEHFPQVTVGLYLVTMIRDLPKEVHEPGKGEVKLTDNITNVEGDHEDSTLVTNGSKKGKNTKKGKTL